MLANDPLLNDRLRLIVSFLSTPARPDSTAGMRSLGQSARTKGKALGAAEEARVAAIRNPQSASAQGQSTSPARASTVLAGSSDLTTKKKKETGIPGGGGGYTSSATPPGSLLG